MYACNRLSLCSETSGKSNGGNQAKADKLTRNRGANVLRTITALPK